MNDGQMTRWEKRKRRTRESLKQATFELLLEHSYESLTIQHITDKADVARGTFYIHFDDKEDITWTLLKESIDELTNELIRKFQDKDYLHRKYLTWRHVFEYTHNNQELLRVMLGDRGHPAFALRIQDYICEFIERGIEAGVYVPNLPVDVPVRVMSQFMTGALVRIMIWSLDEGSQYTPAKLGQMFYEVVYREPLPIEYRED